MTVTRPNDERDTIVNGATLLTVKDVSKLLQVHVRTVWRMVAARHIPAPITLSKRIVRWRALELDQFLRGRRACRRSGRR